MIEARTLSRLPDIRHGFFTRQGGHSTGIYFSLNCGLGSKDDRGSVRRNQTHVATALGLEPADLVTLHQVHSADVVEVNEPWPFDRRPKADGAVTSKRGIALGVLTADCAPILFADETAGVIGAAHAGWRGALSGVGEATIAAMERLGASKSRIVASVGPCISQGAYEVGPEFRDQFLAENSGYARFFAKPNGAERPRFDLPGFIAARLEADGMKSVERIPGCTYEDADNFYSYRRATHSGEADYGRQISAITLGPAQFMRDE